MQRILQRESLWISRNHFIQAYAVLDTLPPLLLTLADIILMPQSHAGIISTGLVFTFSSEKTWHEAILLLKTTITTYIETCLASFLHCLWSQSFKMNEKKHFMTYISIALYSHIDFNVKYVLQSRTYIATFVVLNRTVIFSLIY